MASLPLTSLVTLLVVLLMFITALRVAMARGRYGIKAPAVSGHEMFERALRIQMNTLESVAMMLPALWLYGGLIGDRGAGLMGIVWLAARVWYMIAYAADPARRGGGYGLSSLALALLWLGALWGVGRVILG